MKSLPQFKKLTLSDKGFFEAFTSKFEPYSDFNFTSLYSYDTRNYCEFAEYTGNLLIKYRDYITEEPFYSFIGDNNIQETVELLMDLSDKSGISPTLKLVPEDSVMADPLLCTEFKITEDRDSFDYILSIRSIVDLTGNKFYKHKNVINRFKATYPEYELRDLDFNDPCVREDVLKMVVRWAELTSHSKEETQNELNAVSRVMDAHKSFELISLGVYVDDQMVAFSMEEALPNEYAIAHFGKADKNYIGVYKLIEHESAKLLLAKGCKWLNYEQDLGIEGLRRTKELWYPVKYLKKYTIERL
jgi:hypothetical protein